MMTKRILTTALMLVLSAGLLAAQGRLLERSTDKKPKWVDREVSRHELTKTAASSTVSLEHAREIAFRQLYDQVLRQTTAYLMKQWSALGQESADTGVSREEQIRELVLQSRFMQDLYESAALDSYWEVRSDRRTGNRIYNYWLLYDFNEFEMKKIALECNRSVSAADRAAREL